jgi:hypothetical protein
MLSAADWSSLLVDGGEYTGGFDDVLSASLAPRDAGGVLLSEDGDGLALDEELSILLLDRAVVASVDGVVLEHVDHVVKRDEGVVDRDDIDVSVKERITQHNTADTT